jgi:transcription initiation factor IIE alpha subunit
MRLFGKNFKFGLSTSKTKTTQRQLIFETIEKNGDATCWEIEKQLKLRHQTVSARISEMMKSKRIFDTGKKRLSDSKRRVRVYKVFNDNFKDECQLSQEKELFRLLNLAIDEF